MKIWLVIILLTVNVWGQEKEAKQPVSWQAVARGLQYEPKILEAAEKYRIDPRYVWVIGYLETKFKKEARSPVGAEGLMQFMPATAKRMGVQNTYDPHQSIEGAAKYLKFLYSKFGHPASMMAGYNAGEQAVDCYLKGYSVKLPNGKVINPNRIKTAFGVPPYQETMGYVKEGMRLLALSTWMASAGTPDSISAVLISWQIAASLPVTPSTLRKRMRRLRAASWSCAIMGCGSSG